MLYRCDDQGLRAEVADCDRGGIALGQRALGMARVNRLCEDGCSLNSQESDLQFLLVGHCVYASIRIRIQML